MFRQNSIALFMAMRSHCRELTLFTSAVPPLAIAAEVPLTPPVVPLYL